MKVFPGPERRWMRREFMDDVLSDAYHLHQDLGVPVTEKRLQGNIGRIGKARYSTRVEDE